MAWMCFAIALQLFRQGNFVLHGFPFLVKHTRFTIRTNDNDFSSHECKRLKLVAMGCAVIALHVTRYMPVLE